MAVRSSRREFLQGAAAAAASVMSARLLRGVPAGYSAAEKVNVAQIGTTGKGEADLAGVSRGGGNIVALCDVDASHVAQAARTYATARHHRDFRRMLDTQKDIDAVVVTIPDHQHAFAAISAMQRGKHVYCQKPLTHDIAEARAMRAAASKYRVATQMGNEGHSSEGLRSQVDLIRSGVVGTVREVHVWTNRPIWPQGIDRPTETPPTPEGLDWDLWLGTAPQRPYNPAYHPFKWRGFWDFGTGALGDMGCHLIDSAVWSLDLTGSCSVAAQSAGLTDESGPNWSIVTWEFPARPSRPAVKLIWYDGGKLPPRPKEINDAQWRRLQGGGTMFVGDKGTMCGMNAGRPNVLGEFGRELKLPPRALPRSPGHHLEWIQACKGGPTPLDNFDYASRLTETVLLGNLAIRAGQRIEWGADRMQVTNLPEANRYSQREYRKGWEIGTPS